MSDDNGAAIRAEYARRRRRVIVSLVVFGFMLVPVFVAPLQFLDSTLRLVVWCIVAAAVLGYGVINTGCPACGADIYRWFNAGFCAKCGARLR